MTPEEFRKSLWDVWKSLEREDHAVRITDLENMVEYLRKDNRQKEIEIIRLKTRLADIRNYLNGDNDK